MHENVLMVCDLAQITPDSIERVLRAMGKPREAPELAVARAPPEDQGGQLWG